LIAQHGYWAVFFIVMLESAGVPLPGETALLLAAVYAGATGHLDIATVIMAAAAGAIIGDNFGYWIGRSLGVELLERYGRYIRLTESRLALGRYLFQRHGAKIVFFGRFVAFFRVFAALFAGLNKYGWAPFLIYNAAGGICWALIMGLGAFYFGDSMQHVSGPLGIAALVVAVGGIIACWVVLRRQEKLLEQKLEAAVAAREFASVSLPEGRSIDPV